MSALPTNLAPTAPYGSAPNGGWEYPVFLAIASVVLILLEGKERQ